MKRKPVVLVVIDGWGYRKQTKHNALAPEYAPYFHTLLQKYPHALLEASGEAIGLPKGQIGTSEIGHMTIGAGTQLDTDLVRISKAMESGAFAMNTDFSALIEHVLKHGSTLHVMGLVSPGGVHSHQEHVYRLLKEARDKGITNIAVHAFTDGRDVAPKSAAEYLEALESVLTKLGVGRIASVTGRYYAMDRDNNWERVKRVERMLFDGEAKKYNGKASDLLKELYEKGVTDEHAEPTIVLDESGTQTLIKEHDGVFFFNFRPDRARQLSRIMVEQKHVSNMFFLTMTVYDPSLSCPSVFPSPQKFVTLADVIADAGLSQAHVAETEKYAHATYFLNGKVEEPHANEEFVLIESRKDVPTHDLAPDMRAQEITDAVLMRVQKGIDFIFVNYANADMVGHTANVPAIVEAVKCIDVELRRLVEGVKDAGGIVLITSDHGNVELNVDPESGEKHTAHTENPVPAVLTDESVSMRDAGSLADVAPTILSLLKLEKPVSMTGNSLVL